VAVDKELGFDVRVKTQGDLPEDARAYARERIGHLQRYLKYPVLFAKVKLTQVPNPSVGRPCIAEAVLEVNGRPLRAHVAATRMHEAIDLLERRLRDRIEQYHEQRKAVRETVPAGTARSRPAGLPAERPEFSARPADDRQLVSHKTFVDQPMTVDEAAFDLEQLDYDFYLFRDADSGVDSVLYRLPDGAYGLRHLDGPHDHGGTYAVTFRCEENEAPTLSTAEAIERLDLGSEPFVFFRDPGTGRANLTYRRFDGNYGLLTPE
jgi:ribosome-associated translation inhibitor RaiA